ncbi:Protein CBG16687 [Caenorhabditis briggsae]|uniref:Uncharacterized protein n=2 Tax=Caenorhabditis briggsae TaxID=6238 RepID=A0AAE9FBT5_CAEBR|nr:Protein CBG16687 [Caenorhabditis briggsae]UMM42396.1 hypothetical protein L5515_018242 [Caenorhabditis briggsae]CAP34595.1 Protein CBG16687 [Caenorhabditis briggsae]
MSYSPSSAQPEIKPIPHKTPGMVGSCAQYLNFKIRQLEDTVHNCSQNLDGSRNECYEELRYSGEKELEVKKLMNQLDEYRLIVDSHQKEILKIRAMGYERNHFLETRNFNLRD